MSKTRQFLEWSAFTAFIGPPAPTLREILRRRGMEPTGEERSRKRREAKKVMAVGLRAAADRAISGR
jgi:hypothetical protein